MKKSFTLTRKGSVVNHRRCGLNGQTLIDYHIQIAVKGDMRLDDDLFMVENADIHSLVTPPLKLGETCEVACQNAVDSVHRHFTETYSVASRMKLLRISLEVGMRGGDAAFTLNQLYDADDHDQAF